MNLKIILGGAILAGFIFMTKKAIGSETDIFSDKYDEFFRRSAMNNRIKPEALKAIAANESMVGKFKGLEPIGGTTGIMHIKLETARMFNKSLTAQELLDPKIEIEYGAKYFRWLLDRYAKFPEPRRSQLAVIGYNGGPGRADQIAKNGEQPYLNDSWYKNVQTYLARYTSHVQKLGGSQNAIA